MIHSKVCGPTGDNNDSQVIGELATLLIASLRQIVFIARAWESPVYIFFSIHQQRILKCMAWEKGNLVHSRVLIELQLCCTCHK